jgi:hypothetical protein
MESGCCFSCHTWSTLAHTTSHMISVSTVYLLLFMLRTVVLAQWIQFSLLAISDRTTIFT